MKNDFDEDDYKAQSDADTLHKAAEIQGDPKRHGKAAKHLQKRAEAAKSANKSAQKQLLKKTKGRMGKVFGPKPDPNTAPQMNQDDHGTAQ